MAPAAAAPKAATKTAESNGVWVFEFGATGHRPGTHVPSQILSMEKSAGLMACLLKQFVEIRWLTWVKNG